MGGRGAASGISDKGIQYGTEYHTILSVDNIKFVKKNRGSVNAPIETMSAFKDRIYVTINNQDKIKAITLFDKTGKRNGEIHLDRHNGIAPHIHLGYIGKHTEENTFPVTKHTKLLNKVLKYWKEYKQND